MARATIYLAGRFKNSAQTLQELHLVHQKSFYKEMQKLKLKNIAPIRINGKEVPLPRPFQAISFEGAVEENTRRSLHAIAEAIDFPLSKPMPAWLLFDGTYVPDVQNFYLLFCMP